MNCERFKLLEIKEMDESGKSRSWNDREILRYLGMQGQPVPDSVRELIEECKREREQRAAPRAACI